MKHWRGILGIMVSLGLLLSFLPAAITGAANGPVTVSIEAPAEVAEATPFVALVAVDYVQELGTANFDIVYDPSVITVTGVTNGDIDGQAVPVGSWGYVPAGPDDPGRTRVIIWGIPLPGATGSGHLAKVHFRVLGSACSTSDIALESLAMYNWSGDAMATTTVDGSVHVVAPLDVIACGAEPSPTKVGYATTFSVEVAGGVEPFSYFWTFGDGGSSPDASPTYTYGAAGTYPVTVTVTDDEGDTDHCSFELVVNPPLFVSHCGAAPNPTKVGYATDFSVTVSGGVGEYAYAWNFGDGATSDEATPSHGYTVADTYTVTVTVTDELNNIQTCSFELMVNPPLSLSDCGASPNPTKVGYPTDFSVDVSGGVGPYTYDWDFGDGDGSTDAAPTHTYAVGAEGTHSISVTVTDFLGNVQTCTFDLLVNPPLSLSDCQAAPNPTKVGYPTNFSVTVSGGVGEYTYEWSFGGGNGSAEAAPTHTYDEGDDGTQTVSVTVTDSLGNVQTCTFDLVVHPPLSLSDCGADPHPTKVGYETSFSVTASGGVGEYTYAWDLGDGTGSEAATPTHTYTAASTYAVIVTVTDDLGNVQICEFDLDVHPALAISDAYADPNPTKVDYSTEFCVTISGGVGPYTYHWDLDDGAFISLSIPDPYACVSYAYDAPGTYEVTVTVTDSLDNVRTDTVIVEVNPPLAVSDCQADPDPVWAGQATAFSVNASGGVGEYTYLWNFGDDNGSEAAAPTHTYAAADTYIVSVTVTDELGNVQTCSFELRVKPPVTVSIESPADVAEGTTFVAVVAIDYVEDFDSVSFDVTYDQTIITVTGVTGGEINGHIVPVGPGDWLFIPPGPDDTGRIRVITSMPGVPGPGVTGSGYLAEIHLQVLGLACNTTDIAFEDLAMFDYQARAIPTITVDASVHVVDVPPITIEGQTREVNCDILAGVTVTLYSNGTAIASTVSDGEGNYTLAVPDFGDYTVVAAKDGFRDRQQTIEVTEPTTEVSFVADMGLIPNAPDMSYVLACINLWQFGTPACQLEMSTVLAVISAWQFPMVVA